jgi:hypothetical protein
MSASTFAADTPVALPPDPFPVARYRLECEVVRPLALPDYAGSALRGVFGHALKELACVTLARDCRGCALLRTCPYPAVFETPPPDDARRIYSDIPHPFVVEPPAWGTVDIPTGAALGVGLVLIGPAQQHLPLLLHAWERALRRGLGSAGGTARLLRVRALDHSDPDAGPVLETGPDARLRDHPASLPLPAPGAAPKTVRVELLTPLRLKRDGRPLRPGQLQPRDLLMALVRRTADLCELQLGRRTGWDFAALSRQASAVAGSARLEWRDATRWSNRQQQHTPLGGLVGTIDLEGDFAPFWQLLHLGQWLHVGGKATFGLGRYRLLNLDPGEPQP